MHLINTIMHSSKENCYTFLLKKMQEADDILKKLLQTQTTHMI